MRHRKLPLLAKLSIIIAATMLFAACQSDMADTFVHSMETPIVFSSTIQETNEVRTRGEESDSETGNGLDSAYINVEKYNLDYYIQQCCPEADGSIFTQVGTYEIPSGYEGRLQSKEKEKELKWHNLTSPHTFYAWTMPWLNKKKDTDTNADTNIEWETKTEGDGRIASFPIEFHNSSEADGYKEHQNNAILEQFIGAKTYEPYSYKEHGKYVELTFFHLVSKIKIGSFILIENSGAIQENLKADVTFIGMPTQATFYPHDAEGHRPYVGTPWIQDDNSGVTYYIEHDAVKEDVFYICPEINFSNIDFKVKLKDIKYAEYDTYYGTFDDVKFERRPGSAYDQGEDIDSKILHAGEMMTLNIVLIPGIGPGLSIVIDKWSTDDPQDSQYHTYPGLYSDAEIKDIWDVFYNQTNYTLKDIQEAIDRLFEMYGRTDEDGNDIFFLYENVTIDSNIFPIWKDYILNGMGHTITMKSNTGSVFGSGHRYFNIGPVRDVWLTDGANTIYIDEEGYVWVYNSEKDEYVITVNKLEPLEDPYRSYDISCETGQVHKSTFYNFNLSGS